MDKLVIRLVGRKDRQGRDYYFTTTRVPVSLNLEDAVLHFFPDENPADPSEFGGNLVLRPYTGTSPTADPDDGSGCGGLPQVKRTRTGKVGDPPLE